ncbi:MAG TPA: hypothetical protein VFH61_10455 [Thermoleophilia bacterium]|nr:hypothetical protein [Thermoleophilia bacterium]
MRYEGFWRWLGEVTTKVLDAAGGGLRVLFLAAGVGGGVWILDRMVDLPEQQVWDWLSSL